MGTETEIAGGQRKRGGGSRSHNEAMAELYLDDPSLAVDILQTMLEQGDMDLYAMEVLVRQMAVAFKDGRVVPK